MRDRLNSFIFIYLFHSSSAEWRKSSSEGKSFFLCSNTFVPDAWRNFFANFSLFIFTADSVSLLVGNSPIRCSRIKVRFRNSRSHTPANERFLIWISIRSGALYNSSLTSNFFFFSFFFKWFHKYGDATDDRSLFLHLWITSFVLPFVLLLQTVQTVLGTRVELTSSCDSNYRYDIGYFFSSTFDSFYFIFKYFFFCDESIYRSNNLFHDQLEVLWGLFPRS